MLLVLGFVVCQIAVVTVSSAPMCPKDVPVFKCFRDPCIGAECLAYPDAKCVQNYCGQCGYDFYKDGKKVSCSKPIPCPQINCPPGYRFHDCKTIDSCLFCGCQKICPPSHPCPKDCLAVKRDGCQVSCKCKPLPGPVCPLNLCGNRCPNGYEFDDNGCQTCKCKAARKCPLPMCMIHCPNGFEDDKNGCPSCKCKSSCPLAMCMMHCADGFEVDENGCQICKCKGYIPMEMRPKEAGAPGTK